MSKKPQAPYDPNLLLDSAIRRLKLKNDAALARTLDVKPPTLSKIRHRRIPLGASILLRLHEETGLPTRTLRALMNDRRAKFRVNGCWSSPPEPRP